MHLTVVYKANTSIVLLFLFRRALIVGGHRSALFTRIFNGTAAPSRNGKRRWSILHCRWCWRIYCEPRRGFYEASKFFSRIRILHIYISHASHISVNSHPLVCSVISMEDTNNENTAKCSSIKKTGGYEANSQISRGAEQTASSFYSFWIISYDSSHPCRRCASSQHSFGLREIYQSTEIKLMIARNNFSSIPYVTMRPEIRHAM